MLKLIRNWIDNRRSLAACGCSAYCPDCRAVLNIRGEVLEDHDGLVTYRCECARISTWLFDTPVPILIDPACAD